MKFSPKDLYNRSENGYKLLPFNFNRIENDKYICVNQTGEWTFLNFEDLDNLINLKLDIASDTYLNLKSKHFLIDDKQNLSSLKLLALKKRTKYQLLSEFTSLHMFVVTLRCDHSCPYCQVSRANQNSTDFDMDEKTAEKSLEFCFKSPSDTIKIEFQGGEPLLNFDIIKYIVNRAETLNETHKKNIQFVIATNLSFIDDNILEFCKEHEILISTSLDGPDFLHNRNRPREQNNSYEKTIEGIQKVRDYLGNDCVGALMTTTEESLKYPKEIIDEYINLGFNNIFLRSLSPYGFAIKTKNYGKYNTEKWINFYKEGLDYIIELNKSGTEFFEGYASILLKKILTPKPSSFVDLMNPSGAGISAISYNYDGKVYISDESRMLAEMGKDDFCIGDLNKDSYTEIMGSDKLFNILKNSMLESSPQCTDCAYQHYCGSDPVYHFATQQGDVVGHKSFSGFCHKNMSIINHLLDLMSKSEYIKSLFHRWASL